MTFLQNKLGFEFRNSNCVVFFGNTTASFEKIKDFYSDFSFQRIKQTHSDILVKSSSELLEADAHWSAQKNEALLIATADCIPLMVYCRQTGRALAIHAGWRGVANQITLKALNEFIKTGSTNKDFEFWFGPHIKQNSFEISSDVFLQLEQVQYGLDKNDYVTEANDKYYVDLQKIVVSQIQSVINKKPLAHFVDIDTKTNLQFHSYRRGKAGHERNLSFIVSL